MQGGCRQEVRYCSGLLLLLHVACRPLHPDLADLAGGDGDASVLPVVVGRGEVDLVKGQGQAAKLLAASGLEAVGLHLHPLSRVGGHRQEI